MIDKKAPVLEDSPAEWLGCGAAYLYLILMLLVFPLYYRIDFSQLQQTKIGFFEAVTSVFGAVCLIPLVRRLGSIKFSEIRKSLTLCDIFGVVFLIVILISGLVSINRQESLMPTAGKYIGIWVWLCCIIAYVGLRNFAEIDTILLWCYLIGSGGIFLWGILMCCKINIFHVAMGGLGTFVSPLGNINFNAAFLALALPIAMGMYLLSQEKFTKVILRIYLLLGLLDMFLIRADSIYLAMAAAFCALLFFALSKVNYIKRFCDIIILNFPIACCYYT